ncbi:MAG: hypothetical protein R6W89_01285 [Candidatus Hydrogenedentota bacterium]
MNNSSTGKARRALDILQRNRDTLALVASVTVGFIVLPPILLLQEADLLTMAIRIGVAFVVTYVVVFVFIHIGQWILYNELERQRRQAEALEAEAAHEQQGSKERGEDTHETA